jgi:predicted peroxiredoxin
VGEAATADGAFLSVERPRKRIKLSRLNQELEYPMSKCLEKVEMLVRENLLSFRNGVLFPKERG